jgi:cytochrome bd-type quinol oxidase subunit 2
MTDTERGLILERLFVLLIAVCGVVLLGLSSGVDKAGYLHPGAVLIGTFFVGLFATINAASLIFHRAGRDPIRTAGVAYIRGVLYVAVCVVVCLLIVDTRLISARDLFVEMPSVFRGFGLSAALWLLIGAALWLVGSGIEAATRASHSRSARQS